MTITEIREKIKQIPDLPYGLFAAGMTLLAGSTGFFVGDIYAKGEYAKNEVALVSFAGNSEVDNVASEHSAIKPGVAVKTVVSTPPPSPQTAFPTPTESTDVKGTFVGSRSGKAYHYPWCPGAKRIKEENKVWFHTKEEAVGKGYHPAANCEGL